MERIARPTDPMGRIARPTEPTGRIAGPTDLMGRIARPSQNVSTSVICAPPKPEPAILSLGGQIAETSYSWRLG